MRNDEGLSLNVLGLGVPALNNNEIHEAPIVLVKMVDDFILY